MQIKFCATAFLHIAREDRCVSYRVGQPNHIFYGRTNKIEYHNLDGDDRLVLAETRNILTASGQTRSLKKKKIKKL